MFSVRNFETTLDNLYSYYTFIKGDELKLAEVDMDKVTDGLTTICLFFGDRFGADGREELLKTLDKAMDEAML